MRKVMIGLAALLPAACVQPPNPAVESIKAAREFGKLARDAQEAQDRQNARASDEVVAFQQTDARLHYANATIVRDDGGCAFYQGTTPNGQTGRVPLTRPGGQPICQR